jgi:hypothetical protein
VGVGVGGVPELVGEGVNVAEGVAVLVDVRVKGGVNVPVGVRVIVGVSVGVSAVASVFINVSVGDTEMEGELVTSCCGGFFQGAALTLLPTAPANMPPARSIVKKTSRMNFLSRLMNQRIASGQ